MDSAGGAIGYRVASKPADIVGIYCGSVRPERSGDRTRGPRVMPEEMGSA